MAQQSISNNAKRVGLFILIIIILVILWIVIIRPDSGQTAVEPTPPFITNVLPTTPEPITIAAESIIFQDNFDQTAGAWELSPIKQAQYVSGIMLLDDTNISGAAWARPHLRFQDFVLNVSTRWISGSVGGAYGVRFRLTDSEFLGFYLHNDGWFSIVQSSTLADGPLYEAFSTAISSAGEPNHIHIEAYGNHFRFFVNGRYLVDLEIESPATGDIMFVAQKVEGTNSFRVGFDNLVIGLHPGYE